MRPADFFVRSRQFFGFLIPGAMWFSAFLLALDYNPLTILESGTAWLRGILFLGISYQLGFAIQTVLFHWVYMRLSAPDELTTLVPKVQTELRRQVKAAKGDWDIDAKYLPVFCKWYVLEHSSEIRNVLIEHEGDINLIVGMPSASFVLFASLLYRAGAWHWPAAGVIVALFLLLAVAFFGAVVMKQVKRFYDAEQRECCEMFLLMQLVPPKGGESRSSGGAEG